MLETTVVNGTEPSLVMLDELDHLKKYNKEQLEEVWESVNIKQQKNMEQTNKYPLIEYEIWMGPSGAQGDERTEPYFLGNAIGRNFQDACMRYFMINEIKNRVNADANNEYYDTKRLDYDPYKNTYWGCFLGETKESVNPHHYIKTESKIDYSGVKDWQNW